MTTRTTLSTADIEAFAPEAKIGLVATADPDGRPHITLITTLRARAPGELVFGQFSEGRSKKNLRQRPRAGFLVLTMDRRLWRGRACWTRAATSGTDYDTFNRLPMFRYNAYLGIHTVHHLDLVAVVGPERLPVAGIAVAALLTRLARIGSGRGPEVLSAWSRNLFNDLSTLKFLACMDADGFARIVPLIQCQAAHRGALVFSPLAYGRQLRAVPPGARVAIFGLTMKMESVLVGGVFGGLRPTVLGPMGRVALDWVYNSMPPLQGPVYPPEPLRPVVDF